MITNLARLDTDSISWIAVSDIMFVHFGAKQCNISQGSGWNVQGDFF